MKKKAIYITKFWKTMGIIVTEGFVEQLNGIQYVTVEIIDPRDGLPLTDCFSSDAQDFWLSEKEAMDYVREQQDKEFSRTRNSLWRLMELCDDEARLPIGRVVSLFDDIVYHHRKLPAVVWQGNVNRDESK